MDKEKEIEKMVEIAIKGFQNAECRQPYTNIPYPYFDSQARAIAKEFIKSGYGNVKQVVKEFSERILDEFEKLEEHYHLMEDWNGESAVGWCLSTVKNLMKELYGDDQH